VKATYRGRGIEAAMLAEGLRTGFQAGIPVGRGFVDFGG